MSVEQHAPGQKRIPQTPADKTDAPHRVREESVKNLETADMVRVEASTPLAEVIRRMKDDEGGCAIVCEGERVVGIFTERDLLIKVIGETIDLNSPVSDWMTTKVETLSTEATLGDAVRVMNERGYRNIPLVEGGRLVGSISVFDVITYLAESYPKETMNLPPVPAQVMDSTDGG
jgi:CBS domain-containing protein